MGWISELAREKCVIAPSLLASDFANLSGELDRLERGGAKVVHVDVMDGQLVPNISLGVPVLASIRKATSMKLDVHLMIVEPERFFDPFCKAGADSLTIHIEAVPDPTAALQKIRNMGMAPGLALNYGTPVEKILPYVRLADIVLIMGVPAGFGGQRFRWDSLDSVQKVRETVGLDAIVEIDGGIDLETIGAAAKAGVNLFVAGTGVFRAEDYGAQMKLLKTRALAE